MRSLVFNSVIVKMSAGKDGVERNTLWARATSRDCIRILVNLRNLRIRGSKFNHSQQSPTSWTMTYRARSVFIVQEGAS